MLSELQRHFVPEPHPGKVMQRAVAGVRLEAWLRPGRKADERHAMQLMAGIALLLGAYLAVSGVVRLS